MQRIYIAATLPEAHLVAHLLETALIPVRVFNENANGGVGDLPVIYPEVWLQRDADWQRARRIIESYEHQGAAIGEIQCPRCSETNPATFELCWQCGAALPAAVG